MATKGADPIPSPNVTRWAYHILKAAQASGVSADLVDDLAVAMLCMTHKESRGIFNLTNKTSAYGPMQQLPDFYGERWAAATDGGKHSPDTHFRLSADVLEDHLRKSGGYMPTASFAYGSGGGGVAAWIEQGVPVPIIKGPDGKDRKLKYIATHLEYYDTLYRNLWGPYSAWFAGWVKAGKPLYVSEVEVGPAKTDKAQVTLADHGSPEHKADPIPNPYDGKHRWNGKERLYEPAQAGGGKVLDPNEILKPGEESTTVTLSGDYSVQLGLALALVGAGIVAAWKRRELGALVKNILKLKRRA